MGILYIYLIKHIFIILNISLLFLNKFLKYKNFFYIFN